MLAFVLTRPTQGALHLAIPDASIDPGHTLTLPVNVSETGGLVAAHITILYDPAVLALDPVDGVLKGPLLARGWTLLHNASGDGREAIGVFGAQSVPPGDGVLLNLRFNVRAGPLGTVTTVGFDTNLTATSFIRTNLDSTPCTTTRATVRLGQQIPAALNISAPAENQPVRGTVALTGTVNVPGLQDWTLEVAPGPRPGSNLDYAPLRLGRPGEIIMAAPLLPEGWDSTKRADGPYTLRLRASRTNLDSVFFCRTVQVDNTVPPAPALTLAAPSGQGLFCKSGDTLTLGGKIQPSFALEDAQLIGPGGEIVLTITNGLSLDPAKGAASGTAVLPPTGLASVRFRGRARSAAGNGSPWGESHALTIDNSKPSALIHAPREGLDLAQSNRLAILGTVQNTPSNPPTFGWRLDVSTNVTNWIFIAGGNAPVTNSLLAVWEHTHAVAGREVVVQLTSSNALTSVTCQCRLTNSVPPQPTSSNRPPAQPPAI